MWILNEINNIKNKKGREKMMYFSEVADEWLEYKRNSIKESTYYNYMSNIENHLKPYFRSIKMGEILSYNDFIHKLSQKLSSKTIRDIITILKSIIKYYEDEYNCKLEIKKANLPKLEKKKLKILTKQEKEKLERFCFEHQNLKTLGIVICLNTGLRVGELCSLKWENIDFDEKRITVKKTIQRVYDKKKKKSKIVMDKPKTDTSIRTIPMNKKIYDMLTHLKKNYRQNDFVLSGKEKCLEPRRYQDVFKSILKECKIKPYKFHILRHTFATECIEVGMDIKSLSEILGHADINITLKIYIHSSDKIKKKYLEKL